jgi:tetratricopeptide (TPR) repeat protein
MSDVPRVVALAIALVALAAVSSGAAPRLSFADEHGLSEQERYNRCIKLAHEDPQNAYEQALAWHDAGGGPASIHCSAVALVQLKQYAQAAFKLDHLAQARDAGSAELRSSLLDEAGNAWLLAGQPGNAETSLNAAMRLSERNADLYADRARARGLANNWVGAESDLNVALSLDPYRADLLVLRASARHALGKRRDARSDIEQALDFDPKYADALVERGAMKLESGDKSGARADWQIVLATQPNTSAGDTARRYIEKLEVGPRRATPKPAVPKGRVSTSIPQ